ncbi:complexed with Cdc5 protein Cwf26 [Schizosaccharomyces japonicus yFS275]|uniref:Complexed with Cdc5 protein Cwf26 n=1 Tax=Schizosaccharomyces japonicus (strain yFS275 / FY16936) TaxID=402676 RepID=B6JUZ5_SCHJY|nr:complexed with Cdc5 protein Cwf26 [Schizosaccharomyces japonicus yFS275]EEB05099.1 complexed with Cdc5 protein Cwf26 [Schizosaccharomyces japonicus yFS275]
MSTAEYIAKRYLTKDGGSKKRKKKQKVRENLEIQDDDSADLWAAEENTQEKEALLYGNAVQNDILANDTVRISESIDVKPLGGWKPVGERAIANSVPAVSEDLADQDAKPKYGLVTGKEIAEKTRRERLLEQQRLNAISEEELQKSQKTVYRDATGRRVDIQLIRREASQRLEEERRKELEKKRQQQGEVQLAEQQRLQEELEKMKTAPLARYADDKELNETLRRRSRWNDPAASFLKNKPTGPSSTYQGYAPPNRFDILPGHMWDGVVRGNGFENRWFQRRNELQSREFEAYKWSVEDM